MIRKTIRRLILGLSLFGLSITGYAEVKYTPSLNASTFMGLASNSEKTNARSSNGNTKTDTAEAGSQWNMIWWGKMGMDVEEGKISAHADISTKSYNINKIQSVDAWVKVQAFGPIALKIDNDMSPPGTIGFTATSGIGSEFTYDKGVIYSLNAYTSEPGLEVEYKLNSSLRVYLGLFATDPLFAAPSQLKYGVGIYKALAGVGVTCSACNTKLLTDDSKAGSGSGYSLSMAGALSKQLIVGAGYVVGTEDQYDGGAPWASSAYQLSVKYKIGDDISITADYGGREFEVWKDMMSNTGSAVDGKVNQASLGLMFKIKTGPGELAAIYHSSDEKAEALGSEIKALGSTGQETTLTYDIAMCSEMKCGTKFIYFSDSVTGKASGADTHTQNWMGAQFYARF